MAAKKDGRTRRGTSGGRAAAMLLAALAIGTSPGLGQAGPRPAVFESHRDFAYAIGSALRLLETHRSSTNVPGMQVAVGQEGQLIWSAGLGYSDLAEHAQVTRTTRFRLGSTSKALAGTLVGILAAEGAIDLDAPVQRWVPQYPEKQWTVTPRHLLGHTAGIRHYESREEIRRTDHFDRLLDAVSIFADDPLRFEPGTQMFYSSYGYNLLGAVVEGATDTDFLTALQSMLLEPAGMLHTGGAGLAPEEESTPYVVAPGGERPVAPEEDLSYKWPGGGLSANAEDLVRFGSALLAGELLPKDRVDSLFESLTLSTGEKIGYGFGWALGADPSGRRIVWHSGNMPDARAHLVIYPDLDLVVAILANTGESIYFNDGEAREVSDLFARAVDPRGPAPAPLPPTDYGVWEIRGESPFVPADSLVGELELYRPRGPQGGELRVTLNGTERSFPVGLAERLGSSLRVITAGGTHLQFVLHVEGDTLVGTVKPAWVPPPAGTLLSAPADVRGRVERRGDAMDVRGRRTRG